MSRIELGKNMPQAAVIAKLSEVFNIEPKQLFEFFYLKSPSDVRKELLDMVNNLDDEQLILAYKYVKTFVL